MAFVVWDTIIDGLSIPLKQEGEPLVPKSKKEWNKKDMRSVQLNMKPKDDIKTFSNRFTIIINGLKSYDKIYPNEDVVRKMLRKLPKSWEAKVTSIKEAKKETLTLDELIDFLLTHEMRLNEGIE
ncbi:hypothetical protein PVK06_027300 [Gossypium arboreum]|uniref:UBN2 domain-containing protein n=1 Tax=Gossypium arboreum TaxID=29729 RepID=A0ABR0P164_GOSAR|nr:hypothetical protein PVK06_027300 [Gossypium arboreum]